ncbi:hypothetical protein EDC04DRAFT_1137978 [Pisolithus marmoratus]|nr:hypothetical protein EDC04DRAFT_1137978 [Pisolithus marmoratus]
MIAAYHRPSLIPMPPALMDVPANRMSSFARKRERGWEEWSVISVKKLSLQQYAGRMHCGSHNHQPWEKLHGAIFEKDSPPLVASVERVCCSNRRHVPVGGSRNIHTQRIAEQGYFRRVDGYYSLYSPSVFRRSQSSPVVSGLGSHAVSGGIPLFQGYNSYQEYYDQKYIVPDPTPSSFASLRTKWNIG